MRVCTILQTSPLVPSFSDLLSFRPHTLWKKKSLSVVFLLKIPLDAACC